MVMNKELDSLDGLRREIDRLDDALHDLLMRRAEVVQEIGRAKAMDETPSGGAALRPGREAAILRRLAGRHQGAFPKVALVRIWRELMGALVGIQQPFLVAVHQPERGAGFIELARNHFGVVAPLAVHTSPGQVVRVVADGIVTVGVVPLPAPQEAEPWWLSLTSHAGNLPRIIGRLPFVAAEPPHGRGEPLEAFVIACRDHDETGDDRTLIAFETLPDVSRDRLRAVLTAQGLETTAYVAVHRSDDRSLHLVEVNGHAAASDTRLAELAQARDPIQRCSVIGGYAAPLQS